MLTIRRFDDLGRIVIPKEIRGTFMGTYNTAGMPVAISLDNDTVILKKTMHRDTPRKPLLTSDGYSDGEMVIDSWECPRCGAVYESDETHRFCPNCGQAIDWKGAENGTD